MTNYQVNISQESYRPGREDFTIVFDPIDQNLEDLKHESKPNSVREKIGRSLVLKKIVTMKEKNSLSPMMMNKQLSMKQRKIVLSYMMA